MLSGNCTEALSIQATVTISGSSAKLIQNGIAPLPFPLPARPKQSWYVKRGERVTGHAQFYATLGWSLPHQLFGETPNRATGTVALPFCDCSVPAEILQGMFSGQHCGAGDAGVITEPGRDDINALGGSRHCVIERGFDDDGQHLILQLLH